MVAAAVLFPPRILTVRHATLMSVVGVALAAMALAGSAASASAAPRNDETSPMLWRCGWARRSRARVEGRPQSSGVNPSMPSRPPKGEPVWYRFRAMRRVIVLLGTSECHFDTVVAVYSGRRLSGAPRSRLQRHSASAREAASASPPAGDHLPDRRRRLQPARPLTLSATKVNAPPNDDFVDAARGTSSTLAERLAMQHGSFTSRVTTARPRTWPLWFRLTVATAGPVELNTWRRAPNSAPCCRVALSTDWSR